MLVQTEKERQKLKEVPPTPTHKTPGKASRNCRVIKKTREGKKSARGGKPTGNKRQIFLNRGRAPAQVLETRVAGGGVLLGGGREFCFPQEIVGPLLRPSHTKNRNMGNLGNGRRKT